MIRMYGDNRILDSVVTETGTAEARKISLYGVTSLDEVVDKVFIVKSGFPGVANATMQINSLDAKAIQVYTVSGLSNTEADWVTSGQLYLLYYNNFNFIAFPIGKESSGGGGGRWL